MTAGDEMRAAFEAEYSEGGKWMAAVARSGDGYRLAQTQCAWQAWRSAWILASRAERERAAKVADNPHNGPIGSLVAQDIRALPDQAA